MGKSIKRRVGPVE